MDDFVPLDLREDFKCLNCRFLALNDGHLYNLPSLVAAKFKHPKSIPIANLF